MDWKKSLKGLDWNSSASKKRTGPVQTTGAQSEIGKRAHVYWYQYDKTVDITLTKIKVLINPEELEKNAPKYNYEMVKLSRLLPHYKVKETEQTWE